MIEIEALEIITNALQSDESKYTKEIDEALAITQKTLTEKSNKLRFFITEYKDGNLKAETKHIHYAFMEDLNFDDFPPEQLSEVIKKISDTCEKEGLTAYFVRN